MDLTPTAVSCGLCSCAGGSAADAWSLAAGKAPDAFDFLNLFESPRHASKKIGMARGAKFPRAARKISRCADIMLSAVSDAMAGFDFNAEELSGFGVFFGTSIGGVFETENALLENMKSGGRDLRALKFYECSTIAELVAKRIGAKGPCMTFSTACSSSGLAFAAACDAISQGGLKAALVCGADAISRITVNGFGSLMLLSKDRAKPFDKNRDGINLGEAGGAVLLVSKDFAKQRNFEILAEISGWACTSDAHHATAPHPDGEGAARAMSDAVSMARLAPSDISCVNSHGTGTQGNDLSEGRALKAVFGENVPPFFSVKRAFGHTLGASGVVNAIIAIEALKRNEIAPSLGFENFDEEIGLAPQSVPEKREVKNILSSSLGFGGNNASMVLSKNSSGKVAPVRQRDLFVFGAGSVETKGGACEAAALLSGIPALKKRKWAKLQQMALDASLKAAAGLGISALEEKTGVVFGTGLGMTAETSRFIINTLEKNEAEPLPTAFTNSVHNAAPSLVSLNCKYRGLNSAVTAKEISFECALWQAWLAVNSGALDASIVGACDERSGYAESYMKSFARFSKVRDNFSDFAAAYFVGAENSCSNRPLAKIVLVDIARRMPDASAEAGRLKRLSENCGADVSRIKKLYVPCVCNAWQEIFLEGIERNLGLGGVEDLSQKYGANYSVSAAAMIESLGEPGIYAQYSPASAGSCAFTVFEIL